MWFSPLKGAHLTLGQLDKTLPVNASDENNQKIERGSFVYVYTGGTGNNEDAQFALYTADIAKKANAVPYIALMGVDDFQAGMAGTIGQAPAVTGSTSATGNAKTFLDVASVIPTIQGPRITAISVVQPGEYQTTSFESTETYYVGQPLSISANGKLTPWTAAHNIVGYVTAKPKSRWINDLNASKANARISGGNAEVIEFSTAWIPVAATVSSPAAETDTVKKMDAGAPKVAPATTAPAAAKPATPAK